MLNFRNTTIALTILVALSLILLIFNIKPGMFPLLVVAAWVILLIIGSVKICMGFYQEAFCKGKTNEKVITLTFDDGPDPDVTPQILDLLKKYRIEATFFIIGKKGEKHPEILAKILEDGHNIGVHSYEHAFFFDLYGRKKMERDLVRTAEVIEKAIKRHGVMGDRKGKELFRPPYGVTNPTLAWVVKKLGLRVVGWSVRSLDTSVKDPVKVAERVKKRLHPGAVVLFHDTRKDLPGILEEVISFADDKGYRFLGLEEMIGLR